MTFWNFRFFKIFRKIFVIEKIKVFGKILLFIFLSYLMYNLSEWHRGTPTVPPVGGVNAPPKIRKIQKIHVFGHFFLINYIGFSLKCVRPKSSTGFFIEKIERFSKIFNFPFFSYISSPISESFIAQLLLYRALDKKLFFLFKFWENPYTNFLRML